MTVTMETNVECDVDCGHHFEGQLNPCSLSVPLIDIEEFVETTIVLKKDKKNELGISIVGGSDTYLEAICVSEVHQDGAAFKDGRLKRGDLVLAVNDRSLRDLTWADALKLLREAQSPLRLVILRENPLLMFTTSADPSKFVTVELRKSHVTDYLGLSLMEKSDGQGVFITWVQPGTIAARQGRIMQGDRILEINGQTVGFNSQKEVCRIIKELDGAIVFLLGRIPSLTSSIQEWARRKVGSPGRIRTSTWSYTAKEKLQSQRPSLPTTTNKENYELLGPLLAQAVPWSPYAASGDPTGRGARLRAVDPNNPRRLAASSGSGNNSPTGVGIVQTIRKTLASDPAKHPLVVLEIEEEKNHFPRGARWERPQCPHIHVTNC